MTFWLGDDQLLTGADNPWKIWFTGWKMASSPTQAVNTTVALAQGVTR